MPDGSNIHVGPVGFDAFFFDWYGGLASADRAHTLGTRLRMILSTFGAEWKPFQVLVAD